MFAPVFFSTSMELFYPEYPSLLRCHVLLCLIGDFADALCTRLVAPENDILDPGGAPDLAI